MKSLKLFFVVAAMGFASIGTAWADHYHHGSGHGHFGVYIDPWGPWFYPPALYYPPAYYPQVIVQQPPVYVEQSAPASAPATPAYYWYYCAASQTYYPYVKECPAGWQKVVPQPPSPPQ